MKLCVKDLTVKLNEPGRWVQVGKKDELNASLEAFMRCISFPAGVRGAVDNRLLLAMRNG